MKSFLHVGCGPQNKSRLKGFSGDDWNEIRFDIDKNVNPDIQGTLTDMSLVHSESVDAIYSSHNIEHLYPHEVPMALKEFYRALKPNGFVVITCPDLQTVCESVVNDRLGEPLYISPMGPITPLDILYGHITSIKNGNEYMAHRGGFTDSTLRAAFLEGGFSKMIGRRVPKAFSLWLIVFKQPIADEEMKQFSQIYLP